MLYRVAAEPSSLELANLFHERETSALACLFTQDSD